MDALIVENGICIRAFHECDVPAFVGAVRESVATVGAWMPWCHSAYSEAAAHSWFSHCSGNLQAARSYDVGVFSEDGLQLYGGVSINQLNVRHNFGNIGYWVRESRQRQGVATRAVRAIAKYGFCTLKLTRLEIVAAVDNEASRKVETRVGAVFECVARNRLMVSGQPIEAAVYSITSGQSGF
jgi:RimJ/RimL family protein N-acetyltransferase